MLTMKNQLDLFEYADKQANLESIIQGIHNLKIGKEITYSNICIRRTNRFFEVLQTDLFHECFREVEQCIHFIKSYLETDHFIK